MNKDKIQEYLDKGWEFKYEPHTRYIAAYHPNGGSQSICELKNCLGNDDFGFDHIYKGSG